jgi:hypothetical protein
LKQQQVILGSITATVSAIALGYLGAQYFNKNTMYTVAGAMLGLGATAQITQLKPKSQFQPSKQPISSSSSAIPSAQITQLKPKSRLQRAKQSISRSSSAIPSAQITQLKSKSRLQRAKQSISSSSSAISVTQEPQVIQPIDQPIEQNIERHIEHQNEPVEPYFSNEFMAEIDPIIERFLTLGLEEF